LVKQSTNRRIEIAKELAALYDAKRENARQELDTAKGSLGVHYIKPLNWFERHPFISGIILFFSVVILILVSHKFGWL
jgi:hypothetical protein